LREQSVAEPEAVTAALLRDWSRLCGAIGPRALVKQTAGATLFATGIAAPTLNCVFATGPAAVAKDIDDLLGLVANRDLPYCLQLRPGADPQLEAVARDRGMTPENPIPLMVFERGVVALDETAVNSGLVLRELTSAESRLHTSILASGFDAPMELFELLMTPAVLSLPGARCYVGDVEQEPVTTAFGFTERDHVGIYNVATVPGHRGRGYGTAITARAVLDGFTSGASVAYLQSSVVGYRVYERLGFRTLEKWTVWISAAEAS
jgi:GNAT superfamily N-acetyltransferase